MIRYALACDRDHDFEGWFGSSSDFDEQAQRGLVECPMCQSKKVRKQIMAPAVATGRSREAQAVPPEARQALREMFTQVRRHVETHFDYVGDAFAREARDIHEGRSEERGIYGEASPHEVRALIEDGVRIAPLPPKIPDTSELN